MNNIEKLVEQLNNWRKEYYEGNPLVSDEVFDFEESKLRELDPNNKYFLQIGSKENSKELKIEHKIPMLSMDKVQTAKEAIKWYIGLREKNLNIPIIPIIWYEPKLDGNSGKAVYDNNGDLIYCSSRGDGKIGIKINYGNQINGVPQKFLPNSEIRGEFIINKKYNKIFKGKPLRNICSGLLKRDDLTEELQYVDFVIYDYYLYNKNIIPFKDRSDKMRKCYNQLKSLNKNQKIIMNSIDKIKDIEKLYDQYVNNLRDKWEYETDGMILTVDGDQLVYDSINSKYKITTANKFNIALKPPAEYAKTIIKDIEVTVNRLRLSFVAILEPIFINGVMIQRATLDNYQKMVKQEIGIGSTVLVKRSNDVIPKIIEAYNEPNIDIKFIRPKKCQCCNTKLINIYQDLMCPNEYGCKDIYCSKLDFLMIALGMKYMGEATIRLFVDCMTKFNIPYKFSSFVELLLKIATDSKENKDLELVLNMIKNSSGFGEKRYNILKNYINLMLDSISEIKLLSGFDIPYVGQSELLSHNIRSIKDFYKYVNSLSKLKKTESSFDTIILTWSIDKNHMNDLKECEKLLKSYFKEEQIESKEGMITYCISGETPGFTSKQHVINKLKSLNKNLVFVKDITIKTNYLVTNETNTTKVLKATKYHIPIVTIDEFIKKFE